MVQGMWMPRDGTPSLETCSQAGSFVSRIWPDHAGCAQQNLHIQTCCDSRCGKSDVSSSKWESESGRLRGRGLLDCVWRTYASEGALHWAGDTAGTDMDRGERQEEGRGTQVPMEKYIFKH